MKPLFRSQAVKKIWVLVSILLVIKLVWFVIETMWLPVIGMEHIEKKVGKSLYYRIKLSPNKAPAPTTTKKPVKVVGSIKDIKLLAIYNASDVTVITVEHKKKTKVLAKGEDINGFVLEGAGSDFATFSKNSKIYKITLNISKKGAASIKKVKPSQPSSRKTEGKGKVKGDVIDAGDHRIIDKSLLDHYGKNLDDIYKNIGIKDVKKGENLEGFSIAFIRKGSPFAKLGLEKGDVIKSINGQTIDSYKAAFDVYKNIQNIENLTLGIQRGKEDMELEYEVN